ncbi:hypothetical protein [Alkalicoccus luteus]|uniref:Head-tail adaptor protein n=1 Tax=Alkalicoccus luteus TaxID=1237094 RepID=A0A969PTD3_9BACI|nr:hypothetical protein [Alkalicoccus luteus]NJP37189.1 hypothetical protein [Alkalicoccus luteus]
MAVPWSDVIGLFSSNPGLDEDGFPITAPADPVEVFTNRLSIHSNEYYMAKQQGIELEYRFEIRVIEFNGEDMATYKGQDYEIERTYEKGEFIELVLRKRGDQHGS